MKSNLIRNHIHSWHHPDACMLLFLFARRHSWLVLITADTYFSTWDEFTRTRDERSGVCDRSEVADQRGGIWLSPLGGNSECMLNSFKTWTLMPPGKYIYLYVYMLYQIYASPYILWSDLHPFPFNFTSPPCSLNWWSGETRGVRREFVRLWQARVVFPFPLFEDRPLIDTRAKRRLSEHLFRHRWESKEAGPHLVPRAHSNGHKNKIKKSACKHMQIHMHCWVAPSKTFARKM